LESNLINWLHKRKIQRNHHRDLLHLLLRIVGSVQTIFRMYTNWWHMEMDLLLICYMFSTVTPKKTYILLSFGHNKLQIYSSYRGIVIRIQTTSANHQISEIIAQWWVTTMLLNLVLVLMARGCSLVLNHSLYQPIHDQCYGPMCKELRITDWANLCCEIQFFSPIPITYTALFQNYCHLPHQNRCAHKNEEKKSQL
jgi:hypothetical protein